MSSDGAFADVNRYDQAAQTYDIGRVDYGPKLISYVATEAGLDQDSHVLDLGCGPGTISNAIARYCGSVLAVDPSAAMLKQGQRGAPRNVEFVQGSSDDFSFIDRSFDLVTFGRSFHWMEQSKTLETLDRHVLPGGTLAFLSASVFVQGDADGQKWWKVAKRTSNRLADGNPEELRSPNKASNSIPPVLFKSPFSEVSYFGYIGHLTWTIDRLVAWSLSRYMASSGENKQQASIVRRELEQALAPFGNGPWTSLTEHKVIMARRPDGKVER